MNLISAENLSKIYGDRWLFKNLNFGLNEGEKIGLIGVNGSGKSTLLKILAGIEMPEDGKVSVRKGTKIGFLGQNPVLMEDVSVFDNVFSSDTPVIRLIRNYEKHLESDPMAENFAEIMHDLSEQMNDLDAWNFDQQIKEIISRLGISEYIDRPVKVLSGGQRKRVALAKLLIESPEVLILDEPTNHLDMDTVEWLEMLVNKNFQTLLLVTHDRYFLDNVSNTIVELDQGAIFKYKGNYGYYLEKKASQDEIQNAEIDKAKNLMRKELDWIRRQPKARGTKAKYRVDAFEDISEKANSRKVENKLELSLKSNRQGGKIMELKKINKSYEDLVLLKDLSYTFKKGDKIGIIGKNGMGKTTLLNLFTGKIKADSGDFSVGETTQIGYYTQEELNPKEDKRLIDTVKEIAEVIELSDGAKITASQFLTRFMFPPSEQYKFVSKLSGGEKRRLQLLQILVKNPNFLILDEPTNDLDIGTLNVLEEFLDEYQGTLVLVSHDRYFMDKLVEHLFVFEGQGVITDFPGNYTDWRDSLKQEAKTTAPAPSKMDKPKEIEKPTAIEPKKKLSYKEQKELEKLDEDIPALEKKKVDLENSLSDATLAHDKIIAISKEIQEVLDEIESKSMRWMELSE